MSTICQVCQLSDARKQLLERLLRDGESVEKVGQQFRIDYDAITEHLNSHMQPPKEYGDRVDSMLNELEDVIEAARILCEGDEQDAANFTAYGGLVSKFYEISSKELDRRRKEHEASLESEALTKTLIERVLNPMLTDTTKIVVAEVSRLRDELRKAGVLNDVASAQIDETVRRMGTQLQTVAESSGDTIRSCLAPPSKKQKA